MVIDSQGKAISGYLLQWSRMVKKTDLLECENLTFRNRIGSTGWESYLYHSQVPLRGEDRQESPEFQYDLLCRRSGSKLLILSAGREVIEYLLVNVFNTIFLPNLHQVQIAIDALVKSVTTHPTDYVLSFAHARLPAYGANLRSVSFYGDDLANATFFNERLALMTFFTCGLRHAVGGNEIIRIGTEGSVSFIPTDIRRMLDVERALRFLREEGYLSETESEKEITPHGDANVEAG